ncbi:hypothetical protein FE257_009910 [Aspergillus nanangensis]|uniref:Immediate-early protein n=1 Tax=Aspergillus nanangensis TaxID=2582783 RepID=A0AAD4GYH0_ASPNN|nr:hypothetical protein FE257_009910 [Aspergillus nanangensis]
MVTATRRRTFSPIRPTPEVNSNGSSRRNTKRKTGGADSPSVEVQIIKKRKTSLEGNPEVENESPAEESEPTEETQSETEEKPTAPSNKTHFRFDSEEPEVPLDTTREDTQEKQANHEDEDDSSDDDEAPEAVDNSAQMSKIREDAKRQEEIRQREEQVKREKRKKLDEVRKAQAKAMKKKENLAEDMQSESTVTLQGSITQDARRAALPALLPDEILNATPVARPPTPPAEGMDILHRKPNKLKFLDKTEKRTKDVHMGDVTIRVLDDNVSYKKKSKVTLPPKASKTGVNSKQNWLNKARSTGQINGLRRTTGGSSGFVRR